MPKNNNKQIEEDEMKVIQLLLNDSRQSTYEIARECGFSRQKAWRIIKKLEKEKIIWGYTVVIDESISGMNTYFILVKAKSPFLDITDKLVSRIKADKSREIGINLLGLHYLNGIYDWVVIFSSKEIRDAKRFCGYIQKHYGSYVDRIELLEDTFPLIKFGKKNPNIEKMKEFAIV